jgi:anti-sigma regulatory factor (Ser/Thr protein kinase)
LRRRQGTATAKRFRRALSSELIVPVAAASRVRGLLDTARRQLGVDIAYFSKLSADGQHVQCLVGNSGPYSFGEGSVIPLEETYCRRMVEGTAPGLVPDAAVEPRMQDLGVAGTLGSYLGVPVRLPDGRIYGSVCCASRTPSPEWDSKDRAYLQLLADSVGALVASDPEAGADAVDEDRALRLSLWFTGVARAPTSARASLSTLEPFLGGELLQSLRLLITELMTNCIRHAGVDEHTAIGLEVCLSPDRLRCVVADPGPGFERPEVIQQHADRPGGFGLVILDSIADHWGLTRDELFRVWFDVDVQAALA